jgi:leucine dehydrogenase
MAQRYEELLRDWDGELVASRFDLQTGAFLYICVHSTLRGPAAGGIRLKSYGSPLEALRDGMRLSSAMTLKMAICDAPLGGGKSVIAVDPAMPASQRPRVLERYAELLGSLRGTYYGAPDMNTGPDDMDFIHERSPYVFCRTREHGGSGSTTPATALGVFHGIVATAQYAFGSRELAGRTVLVQGVGGVGGELVGLLLDAGAKVIVSDVVAERVAVLVKDAGVAAVPPESAATPECDIFAPCAVGGVLNERSIPELRCAAVAGGANNQLETPQDDARLKQRGIAYAPDFVVNAGGVLHGVGLELWDWDEARVAGAVERLGDTLLDVFATADSEGIGTQAAAELLARSKLA